MALSIKDPEETINITFDFSSQFTTVSNPEVTVTVVGDTTDITAMKGSNPIVVTSNKVVVPILGGESGVKYDLRCQVDTDTAEVVVAKDVLTVKTL